MRAINQRIIKLSIIFFLFILYSEFLFLFSQFTSLISYIKEYFFHFYNFLKKFIYMWTYMNHKIFFFLFNVEETKNIKEMFFTIFFIIRNKFFFYRQNENFSSIFLKWNIIFLLKNIIFFLFKNVFLFIFLSEFNRIRYFVESL